MGLLFLTVFDSSGGKKIISSSEKLTFIYCLVKLRLPVLPSNSIALKKNLKKCAKTIGDEAH